MNNFIINVATLTTRNTVHYAAQALGTASNRPIHSGSSKSGIAAACYEAFLACLNEMSGYLKESDMVEVNLPAINGDPNRLVSKGSGDKTLDKRVRLAIHSYLSRGIDVNISFTNEVDPTLRSRVSMAAQLGM